MPPQPPPQGRNHWVTFGVEMEFLFDWTQSDRAFLKLNPPEAWWKGSKAGIDAILNTDQFLINETTYTQVVPVILRALLVENGFSVNPTEYELVINGGPLPPGELVYGQRHPNKYDNWSIEPDLSIKPQMDPKYKFRNGHLPIGFELISPKLVLNQRNLLHVQAVLELVKKQYYIWDNVSTAVHVNIGNQQLGFPDPTIRRLFQFYTMFEDEIATLLEDHCTLSEEFAYWCRTPSLNRILEHDRDEIDQIQAAVSHLGRITGRDELVDVFNCLPHGDIGDACRYYCINARGMKANPQLLRTEKPRKPVFEFRQHHGTKDWNHIRNWILFCGSIVELCHETEDALFDAMLGRALDRGLSFWDWLKWINEPRLMPFYIKRSIGWRRRFDALPDEFLNEEPVPDEGLENDFPPDFPEKEEDRTRRGEAKRSSFESPNAIMKKTMQFGKPTERVRYREDDGSWTQKDESEWPVKSSSAGARFVTPTDVRATEQYERDRVLIGNVMGVTAPRYFGREEIEALHRVVGEGDDQIIEEGEEEEAEWESEEEYEDIIMGGT